MGSAKACYITCSGLPVPFTCSRCDCCHAPCAGVIWPLLHYTMPQTKLDFAEKWDDTWQAYTGVNSIVRPLFSLRSLMSVGGGHAVLMCSGGCGGCG
jgi:hypothetical protein